MVSASEEIAARKAKYAERQYAVDKDGRNIGVSRLRPSEQIKVREMTPNLDGIDTFQDDDPNSKTYGKTFEVAKRTPAIIAASVREIDGSPISFPKNRGELDAVLDRLDSVGLEAAGEALSKFDPVKKEPETSEEAAKNSQGTLTSESPAG